ncbi:MAG: TIGR03087 family PEP-CTERM/XrtA system glycosyltransferase [Planctomycetota bacterium]|jgi:sugar transferase (PEP-CTERM/EpsH1 system associated)
MSDAAEDPRPRILFLVHRIPYPPDKGDKIRSYHELMALREGADVTVACFLDDPEDEAHVATLGELCHDLVVVRLRPWAARLRSVCALAGRCPLSLAHYRSREMRRRLRELGPFDAVLAFSSTMGPYAERFAGARRVLDLCDLDSEKWFQYAGAASFPMSWIYRSEGRRLGAYEDEAARAFDAAVLVSPAEGETLRRRCPAAAIHVIPNGVDLDFLDPDAVPTEADARTLVFCGAMDYHSNVDAVRYLHDDILPLVRKTVPDVRLKIVGSNPAPAVTRLADSPGVEVTGRVPDVRPEILSAAVSVAPMRLGRGVPNKVLEALALTLPVVVTPNAAMGLELGEFEGADVAGDAPSFADAVVRRLRAAAAGRVRYPQHRHVLHAQYSWSSHMGALRRLVLGQAR